MIGTEPALVVALLALVVAIGAFVMAALARFEAPINLSREVAHQLALRRKAGQFTVTAAERKGAA